ncbi:MAG: diguanylate cyclase [Candidatus Obscuribacter sp.]|jgi:diguanylate cyclase (GGDEF)-like protein|nr:diguanylate cyclase [Candidatus Obscuribacter sp.]MDQ5964049.1 Diguanylate cyclase [Cyanobacteriota bacterium erpe_2018_sw_39hr_WHONDRS-SW48-000098_B_bin.30]MBK9206648.1 diguanylate cyclase [Candidatus Obscuribacter sp.]MBK9620833.1 diguanylate cyclase [Candidatus Obscuribacter sp.]MBL0189615.1 diguanylate cyclase [Candidatus Obscuribacter sp.]
MSPDNKPDERYTRDSLFKAKLTDIRRQERKKTEETKKILNARSSLATSKTIMPPEEEVSTGKDRHHVLKDPKTGLYTERFVKRVLKEEVKRAKRYKNSLGIIVGTIINAEDIERSGGPIAKAALDIESARVLQECIRDVDVPGKLDDGGFIVVCPETGEVGLQIIIERLHKRLNYNQKVNLRTTWEPVFCFEAAAFGTSLNNPDFLLNSALEKLTLTALETKAEMENVVNEEKW